MFLDVHEELVTSHRSAFTNDVFKIVDILGESITTCMFNFTIFIFFKFVDVPGESETSHSLKFTNLVLKNLGCIFKVSD